MAIYKFKSAYFLVVLLCVSMGWGCNLEVIPPDTEPVGPTLSADFSFKLTPNDFAPCVAEFTDKSAEANTYAWYIKSTSNSRDSQFSTIINPTINLTQPDSFTVTLVVKNPSKFGSASQTVTKGIRVNIKTFENTLSAFGIGRKVIQTSDGSFIIAGTKTQVGSSAFTDGYVIKIAADGTLVSTFKNLIINMSNEDEVNDLIPFIDGSVGVIGTTLSKDGTNKDIFYAQISSDLGTLLKDTTRIGISSKHESALGAVLTGTPMGWFAVCGYSTALPTGTQNAYLFNRSANTAFSSFDNPYASTNVEVLNDIVLNADGGFISVGKTKAVGSTVGDVLFMRVNSGGVKAGVGAKSIGMPLDLEEARAVTKTRSTAKFFVAGTSFANGSLLGNFWFLLTDQDGLGTPFSFGDANINEESRDVIEQSSGNFVIVGIRGSNAALVKTDAQGQSPVTKTYGIQAKFNALCETKDGGLLLVGSIGSSLYIVKTDKDGNL